MQKSGRDLPESNTRSHSSQAALEFLMVYGLAISAVLIVIASLSYFGVLRLDSFAPKKCILPPGIACIDYKVETHQIILVLQNVYGETMTIDQVTVSSGNQQCSSTDSVTLQNKENVIFTITSCNNGAAGSKFNGAINIAYSLEQKLSHYALGTLRSDVQEGSSTSSQDTCQNAAANGLCDGLDIVYGLGYKSACCGEFGLCC